MCLLHEIRKLHKFRTDCMHTCKVFPWRFYTTSNNQWHSYIPVFTSHTLIHNVLDTSNMLHELDKFYYCSYYNKAGFCYVKILTLLVIQQLFNPYLVV